MNEAFNTRSIYLSSTVAKALAILKCFRSAKQSWGVSELARHLKLPKSMVYRYVLTLEAEGFLRRKHGTIAYELGIDLFYLGMIVARSLDLWNHADPYLELIVSKLGGTASIKVMWNEEVLTLKMLLSQDPLDVRFPTGVTSPYYCGAHGKLLSAYLFTETEIDRLLKAKPVQPLTPTTLVRPAAFKKKLEKIRREGFAVDREETQQGVIGVSVPVRSADRNVVASIGSKQSVKKFSKLGLETILETLRSAATGLSTKLGYGEVIKSQDRK